MACHGTAWCHRGPPSRPMLPVSRTSRTQSPAFAEVSLSPKSQSLTWGGRRGKRMSSHSVATRCRINRSCSRPKPWGCPYLCQQGQSEKPWQRRLSHPTAAPPLPCHLHQHVLCWGRQARGRRAGCLWKAPGHGGQGPHWPNNHVHLHKTAGPGARD